VLRGAACDAAAAVREPARALRAAWGDAREGAAVAATPLSRAAPAAARALAAALDALETHLA
jgi:hypothetical protein